MTLIEWLPVMSYSQWLIVTGLTADILGFGLIVLEWQRGVTQAEKEAIEAAVNAGAWGVPEERKAAVREAALKKIRLALGPRKRLFGIGALLILLGFFCQIVGTVLASQSGSGHVTEPVNQSQPYPTFGVQIAGERRYPMTPIYRLDMPSIDRSEFSR